MARPCVIDRIAVAYPNISDSGTRAVMTCALPRGSMPSMRPRRELRSPITSPMYSSGVMTSTANTGSSSTGPAFCIAFLNAIEPAILNAISDESTSWYEPSTSVDLDVDHGVAGEHAGLHRLLDALRRPTGCTPAGSTPPTILFTNS